MREFGITVSNEAAQSLFNYYSASGGPKDGQELNFDQFIIMMRGYLNPQRRNLVHRAFRKMDKDGSGVVDWADLKGVYNVAQHPKVLTGTISLVKSSMLSDRTFCVEPNEHGQSLSLTDHVNAHC